ncbi:DUF1127 domain-containing protein [Tropicimonas sp. IMCC34043]|uniref:DUF1127 domain-containing protein n=1 Tax=Tropicimonas sp. IMCC34043 TaxID=2248760 RepID=UPI000E23289F|nr:DUF1127 domain-containing protein [Tropicimonas sp. IMCC34043]
MTYTNQTTVSGLPLSGWTSRISASYKAWRAGRAVYTQIYNELSSLSDRELADIGLSRNMIRDIALQAAYEA